MEIVISWLWLLRRSRTGLIALLLGVALFELLQPVAIASLGDLTQLNTLLRFVPPSFYALMNVTPDFLESAGLAGYLALGYTHPIYHILSLATVTWFACRALAGEMERGTIQLALSRPVSRSRLYLSRVFGVLTVTAGVAIIGPIGMLIGLAIARPDGSLDLNHFIQIALATGLLTWSIGGIALAGSAAADRMGQAIGWVIAILVISYVVDYFAAIWSALKSIQPFSIFNYYDPAIALSSGTLPLTNVVVLGLVGLLGASAGLLVFTQRDLPT
jgi:beta-exotoxin I transport system permease protein